MVFSNCSCMKNLKITDPRFHNNKTQHVTVLYLSIECYNVNGLRTEAMLIAAFTICVLAWPSWHMWRKSDFCHRALAHYVVYSQRLMCAWCMLGNTKARIHVYAQKLIKAFRQQKATAIWQRESMLSSHTQWWPKNLTYSLILLNVGDYHNCLNVALFYSILILCFRTVRFMNGNQWGCTVT